MLHLVGCLYNWIKSSLPFQTTIFCSNFASLQLFGRTHWTAHHRASICLKRHNANLHPCLKCDSNLRSQPCSTTVVVSKSHTSCGIFCLYDCLRKKHKECREFLSLARPENWGIAWNLHSLLRLGKNCRKTRNSDLVQGVARTGSWQLCQQATSPWCMSMEFWTLKSYIGTLDV